MDKQCDDLMAENLSKNFIDSAEYPQCSVIESKCGFSEQISEYKIKSKVAILRHLFHAPEASIREERSVYRPSSPPMKIHGKSTVGSSEAIMLSAMNLKWMWQRQKY